MCTGKFNHLVDEPKRWKANFRCALNSLPDVQEVKELGQKRGNDPFKVYEFLPEQPRKSQTKSESLLKFDLAGIRSSLALRIIVVILFFTNFFTYDPSGVRNCRTPACR